MSATNHPHLSNEEIIQPPSITTSPPKSALSRSSSFNIPVIRQSTVRFIIPKNLSFDLIQFVTTIRKRFEEIFSTEDRMFLTFCSFVLSKLYCLQHPIRLRNAGGNSCPPVSVRNQTSEKQSLLLGIYEWSRPCFDWKFIRLFVSLQQLKTMRASGFRLFRNVTGALQREHISFLMVMMDSPVDFDVWVFSKW